MHTHMHIYMQIMRYAAMPCKPATCTPSPQIQLQFSVSSSVQDFTGRVPNFSQVTSAFNKSFRNWHPFGQLLIAWGPGGMEQQRRLSLCHVTS